MTLGIYTQSLCSILIAVNVRCIGCRGTPTSNLPPEIIRFKNGVSLLGSPIWGSPDYSSPMVACLVDRLASSRLKFELDDPPVELHPLRSCLGVGKINRTLRTVPKQTIKEQLARFDCNLRLIVSKVAHNTIVDLVWQQVLLPFWLGGLGLWQSLPNAHITFFASYNASCNLVP